MTPLPDPTRDRWDTTGNNDPATVRRAIRLLADRSILHRTRDTGHYHVSATRPATGTPAPPVPVGHALTA
jgi:hypothetical protein